MKNLKVGQRLALAFTLIGLVMALSGGFAGLQIWELRVELESIAARALPNTVIAGKFTVSLLDTTRMTRGILLADDPAMVQQEVQTAKKTFKDRAAYLALLLAAYLGDRFGNPPSSAAEIAWTGIVAELILLPWAWWFDHHRKVKDSYPPSQAR